MSQLESQKKFNAHIVVSSESITKHEVENGTIIEYEDNIFVDNAEGPDFRGVSTFGAAVLIAKTQFGLGVLGLPHTFDVLGFVPGLISLIALCCLSTWAGAVAGKFRLSHPQVHSIGDATCLMFGKHAGEIMGFAFWLFYTLSYGSALLTVSIAFNSLTEHAICTTAWIGIGAALVLIIGIVTRTLKVLAWCGYAAVASVFFGVWIVAIACLTQTTPAVALESGGPVEKVVQVVGTGSSYIAIASAVSSQLFSLCGTASFFTIHAEMHDQTKYLKSLFMGQGFVAFNYIVISSIIYGKVGQYVASPSLGSAGMLIQKIAYGISFPGLLFTCFYQAHFAAKYALVRILRGTSHLQSNSKVHWFTWTILVILVVAIGFVIAGAIPFFDDLFGLVGALLGSFFTLIIPAFMVIYELTSSLYGPSDQLLHMRISSELLRGKKNVSILLLCFFSIAFGSYICVSGTYGSIASIAQGYADGTVSSAFSCEDNSR